MLTFFAAPDSTLLAVQSSLEITEPDIEKLTWLFGNAKKLDTVAVTGTFRGPRKEMITPWSTNAVEITQNMGITGITRIEEFYPASPETPIDPCLLYTSDAADD